VLSQRESVRGDVNLCCDISGSVQNVLIIYECRYDAYDAYARNGHQLPPLAVDISFWTRLANALAIGSCTLFPLVFANGM